MLSQYGRQPPSRHLLHRRLLRHGRRAGRRRKRGGSRRLRRRHCRSPPPRTQLPIAKLKLPRASISKCYASGVGDTRARCGSGDKGTVFVSTALSTRSTRSIDKDGKREVKTLASGLDSAERHRLRQRHALHRRDLQDLEDRQDRGQARQSAEADRDLRRSAERRAARLEVPRRRSRQQALFQCRRAVQHLHAVRPATPRSAVSTSTAAAWKSSRAGIRQIVGMDWHPGLKQLYFTENQRDWLSEDMPEGQAQPAHPARQGQFRLPLLSQRRHSRPGIRLGPQLRRVHQAGGAVGAAHRRRSACASTPATMFPARIPQCHLHRAPRLLEPESKKIGGDIVLVSSSTRTAP